LEQGGYVYQPHTSAGRVPTDRGYRCYVDLLLQSRRAPRPTPDVEARLRQAGTVSDVLSNVSHELSRVAHHLSFALAPSNGNAVFRYVEFVRLEGTKILVVITAEGNQVSHKVIDLGEPVSPSDLTQGANYLNREYAGLPLWQVRAAVIDDLRQERMFYDQLLSRALRLASSTLAGLVPLNNVFIEGAGFLLDEMAGEEPRLPLATLRALLSMIEQKHRLVCLLNEYIEGPGLTVVIGTEHSTAELQEFSLVASTYDDGRQTGTIGVIGPRRMHYSRAIAAVDSVSHAVSRVLVGQTTSSTEHGRRHEIGTA
jgi:heat-inducible transcriptional repressor